MRLGSGGLTEPFDHTLRFHEERLDCPPLKLACRCQCPGKDSCVHLESGQHPAVDVQLPLALCPFHARSTDVSSKKFCVQP